jgi:hypothetical protein
MASIVIARHGALAIKLQIVSIERNCPFRWEELYRRERWQRFEQVRSEACGPRRRYRLSLRTGHGGTRCRPRHRRAGAWVERYDAGEWDDPPGKLALLYDLERVAPLLRDGTEPFHPDRDRIAFAR